MSKYKISRKWFRDKSNRKLFFDFQQNQPTVMIDQQLTTPAVDFKEIYASNLTAVTPMDTQTATVVNEAEDKFNTDIDVLKIYQPTNIKVTSYLTVEDMDVMSPIKETQLTPTYLRDVLYYSVKAGTKALPKKFDTPTVTFGYDKYIIEYNSIPEHQDLVANY